MIKYTELLANIKNVDFAYIFGKSKPWECPFCQKTGERKSDIKHDSDCPYITIDTFLDDHIKELEAVKNRVCECNKHIWSDGEYVYCPYCGGKIEIKE